MSQRHTPNEVRASATPEPMRPRVTRRQFLRRTAAAGGLIAVPYLIPASALGQDGNVAPSERITLGGIGIGGRGSGVLNWMMAEKDVQFLAVCDPQKSRREKVKQMVDKRYGNQDCAVYKDTPEFLATRDDIDAMLITTGDRWHATMSVMAMRAGKDVYSEKPSCMTIAEGQAVVETANRFRRIYQTGTQRLSEAKFILANELLRTGRLGKLHTVRAHIAPWDAAEMRHDWLPEQPLPSADEVNWDAWLGPCPWRPYNAAYCRGGWRGHYDFHTSCIGEWGAHTFAQCHVAIGATDTSPVEYGYVDNPTGDGMVTRFANGVKMILHRGDKWWHGSCGVRYEGTEGWVAVADGYSKPEASSPALLADFEKIVRDYTDRTGHPTSHVRDLFDSVKSRRPTVANPEVMYRSMTTVHAANICMWLKRDLKYDPAKAEFVDDAEANRLRSRAMREPWII
ncbi:MAG: Gfo/Idh/MocA family oxidoreductase [Candidatus Nealsonbacteria bacterium]|nr:Gfo/Idh/MocA family oxidoreductase [Candidatus Nealsonbacteria bacterium]